MICYDALSLISFPHLTFAPLNVVVFVRRDREEALDLNSLPRFGLPDCSFISFADRPGLMTKREVRLLILGELALKDGQTVWDIGAGTGSVSIEIARFCPNSQIYAIEKTAVGVSLIQRNCDRFQVNNVKIFQGNAPESLEQLPTPDRIFIGGSGGNLTGILSVCSHRLSATGSIVLAVATLEHLAEALNWVKTQGWYHHLLQVSISRSVPIAFPTRFAPLNPVTILTIGNK